MWDEQDGFFYDVLRRPDGSAERLKVRSVVGLLPLCAAAVFEPSFGKMLPEVARAGAPAAGGPARAHGASCIRWTRPGVNGRHLLSIVDEAKLRRILAVMLDEAEFLGPHGIRSLSRRHAAQPYVLQAGGQEFRVGYLPAESDTGMFGGNSNWRGPVWMPVNAMLVRALLIHYAYHGDDFRVECPTGSGRMMTLFEVAREITGRLAGTFLRDAAGQRPVFGGTRKFQDDPHWRDCLLFYEYFHGDNGAGLGASHQTGWTGVVATLMHLFATVTPEAFLAEGGRSPPSAAWRSRAANRRPARARARPRDRRCRSRLTGRTPRPLSREQTSMPDIAPTGPGPLDGAASGRLPPLPLYPSLFQLNTRVRLRELEAGLGRPATLDDIPDAELDRIAAQGFDWLYFLGVWSTGEAGRQVSRSNPEWRREFEALLPDLEERDICGSSFAVTAYAVHPAMGGNPALERLRRPAACARPAADAGLRPEPHGAGPPLGAGRGPELFVRGSQAELEREPGNYMAVETARGPDGPGAWPRSLLPGLAGYAAARLRQPGDAGGDARGAARRRLALRRAALRHGDADPARGVPAHLGHRRRSPSGPAPSRRSGRRGPDFVFMAEVYWDLEWTMLQQGFDYAYDKTPVRPRGRRQRPRHPRAPARRPRLPAPPRPLPREP